MTGVSLASWLVMECSQTGHASGRLQTWCTGLCDGGEVVASAGLVTCPRQGPVSLSQEGCCQRGPACPWGKHCEHLVSAHPSLSVLGTGKLRTKSTLEIQDPPVTRVTSRPIGRVSLPIPEVWIAEIGQNLRDHLILTKCGNYYKMWKLDPPKGKTRVSAPTPGSLTTS